MKQKLLQWSMFIVALVMMAACSDSGNMKGLLEMIPEDADYVATGNVKTILESAGGSLDDGKIKLPGFAKDLMSNSDNRELDELNDKLKNSGVNIEAAAIGGYYKSNSPVLVLALNDMDKFKKAIEDEDFREYDKIDGVEYYKKGKKSEYSHCNFFAFKEGYACYYEGGWGDEDADVLREIKKFMEKANDANYAGTTFGDYICEGNVGGVALRIPSELRNEMRRSGVPSSSLDMMEGVVCIKGDLTADAATVKIKMYGEDGKEKDMDEFKKMYDMSAKVSKDALAYMNKNEVLVAATCMKDVKWDNLFDQMSSGMSRQEKGILNIVKGFFEKIDGTVAVGLGLTNGIESFANLAAEYKMMSSFSFTFVIEAKDGMAKRMVDDCKSFLDAAELTYEDIANGLAFDLDQDCKAYLQADGNFLVLSNHKIQKGDKNATVEGISFSDYIGAGGIVLNRDNQLMKDLRLKYDVKLYFTGDVEDMETTITYEIKGGDDNDGVIAKTIKMFRDIAAQGDRLDDLFDKVREEKYGDYVSDSVAVDSVAVEEYEEAVDPVAEW